MPHGQDHVKGIKKDCLIVKGLHLIGISIKLNAC